MRQFLFIIALTYFALGCASSLKDKINDLRPGADKTDVLDAIGSPHHKSRKESIDIWTYSTFEDDTKTETNIYFKNGKIISSKKAEIIMSTSESPTNISRPSNDKEFLEYKKSLKKIRKNKNSQFEDVKN